jgi:murein DD-endopeptidase MepM/ murein hydrolase activator NlpD
MAAWVSGVGLVFVLASWGYLFSEAMDARELRVRVAELERDVARVEELNGRLVEMEEQYEQLRQMFMTGAGEDTPPQLWLPPTGGRAAAPVESAEEAALPTTWPLTERGFVTRSLLAGNAGEHSGLDVAVPTDSYVRAAGAGVVAEVREDPVYGHFLRVDHENGYVTLYAHANEILVSEGDAVLRGEVVALSGSTGQSTAPHLHFEILREGAPVDPLTLVTQP